MKRTIKLCHAASPVALSLSAVLFLAALAPFQPVPAQSRQRLVRPPDRDLEGTPILPAGTQSLPEGTTLILVMETRLDSSRARVSDRFQATIAIAVVDASGRTLIPQGALVEGHVTNVEPAKWRSRSGIIGINFDYIFLDGRKIPIRGYLAPADERTRKQMDSEGNLKGGSSLSRTFFFVGGGAGAGATVAAFTSAGVLVATGIGAAAGLTTALLWKGREAVVEEGQRFGLQLTSPLRVAAWYNNANRNQALPVRGRTTRLIIPDSNIGLAPPPARPATRLGQGPSSIDPGAIRIAVGAVAVHEVRAERGPDGYLRTLITAQTPTNGWRIYTHHQISGNNDTLEIRLRGFPPSSYGYRQVSHPSAPTIIVQDPNRAIARVIVHGSNGTRTVVINPNGVSTAEPYRPPGPPPPTVSRPFPNDYPSDGSAITIIPPATPAPAPPQTSVPQTSTPAPAPTTLPGLASQVASQLELFRENYAVSIGGWRNRDGTYEFLGQRKPNANERQMLDAIGYLITNIREIARGVDVQSRRAAIARIRDDYQVAGQTWTRIPASPELNRRWQAIQQNLQAMVNAAN